MRLLYTIVLKKRKIIGYFCIGVNYSIADSCKWLIGVMTALHRITEPTLNKI